MPKTIIGQVRLQLLAGVASPAPPIGPALGVYGVNIMNFCKEFNSKTKEQSGMTIPVIISIFSDRSFSFILKSPPASILLKKSANISKGSKVPHRDKVGRVTKKQLIEIVNIKFKDLNTESEDSAVRIIEGTARSMGIEIIR